MSLLTSRAGHGPATAPRPLNRRDALRLSAATFAGLLPGPVSLWAAEPRKPNVVLIVSDDQGWTDFGFMGHPVIRTPRLDKLAAEGAVFPAGYVPTSLCRASLATLLTGLYPRQHRICCNDPPAGVDRTAMHPFLRDAPALPRLLGKAGYRSLQTGKFWEGHYANAGFTEGQTTNADRHISRQKPQIGRQTMTPIFDFLDRYRERPFFVWYAPMMPHQPHDPPERLLKHYAVAGRDPAVAKYYAMCEWFDETCGQLLDHLDKLKLRDSTLVLFCVDNGWVQPLASQPQNSFGAPRGKRSPYDMGVRTPVVLRWPGRVRLGRCDDLVQTLDVAPTVLRACGVEVPARLPGLDLLPVATGKGRLRRDAVFGEIYTHTASKLGCPATDVLYHWVRAGDWKLIAPTSAKEHVELFNLAQDPHEHTDLSGKQPEKVKQLRQSIDKWLADG